MYDYLSLRYLIMNKSEGSDIETRTVNIICKDVLRVYIIIKVMRDTCELRRD